MNEIDKLKKENLRLKTKIKKTQREIKHLKQTQHRMRWEGKVILVDCFVANDVLVIMGLEKPGWFERALKREGSHLLLEKEVISP